jgi:hypothetical protein
VIKRRKYMLGKPGWTCDYPEFHDVSCGRRWYDVKADKKLRIKNSGFETFSILCMRRRIV